MVISIVFLGGEKQQPLELVDEAALELKLSGQVDAWWEQTEGGLWVQTSMAGSQGAWRWVTGDRQL